jgi:2-C-methyl-D-erythritol 4-phosphate cytidylyltransferase
MRSQEKKQFLALLGKPVLAWTVDVFEGMNEIREIVIVASEDDHYRINLYREQFGWTKVSAVVIGGRERQDSVLNGLKQVTSEWVLVHDAVRPLVEPDAVRRCMQAALLHSGAVLAVPVKDTIKIVSAGGRIEHTPDRSTLWAMHTPQVFRLEELLSASLQAIENGWIVTDDASVMERVGATIVVVQDDERNIKLTTPEDLAIAEKWLLIRQEEQS